MLYRLQKFFVSSTHVALIVLLVVTICGAMPISASLSFALISVGWLLLTLVQLKELLSRYEDRLMRRQVQVPAVIGMLLCALALMIYPSWLSAGLASLSLAGWWFVNWRYRLAGEDYVQVGAGYLRKDVWVNPPIDVIPEFALVATDGRMARRAKNSIGHSELVVKDPDGKLWVASSYIEKGVVLHTLRAFIATERKNEENYIVLVPTVSPTATQSARGWELAKKTKDANKKWRDEENESRKWWFTLFFVPAQISAWLVAKAMSTGYDGIGKWWGRKRANRYTCMAHNLLIAEEVGMPVGEYGTGAFGICGEANPLLPIRFLKDPAWRVLTSADQDAFNRRQASAAPKDEPK